MRVFIANLHAIERITLYSVKVILIIKIKQKAALPLFFLLQG
jgi:hypothetical protein